MDMKRNKGFTLIELMVVISIITLVSSVIFASLNIARAKARDARKIAETNSVRNAVNLYYASNKTMPNMYDCTSTCGGGSGINNGRATLEIEDQSNPTTESGRAYRATMNELVSGGFLAAVPSTSAGSPYSFYNYGSGNAYGVMFGTTLEVPKTQLVLNSCKVTAIDLTNIDCAITNTGGPGYIANCYVNCKYYTNTSGAVTQVPATYVGQPLDGRGTPLDGGGNPTTAICKQVRSLCDPSNSSDYCLCNSY